MGHDLEALKESEKDGEVVYNLFWTPSKAVVSKLNKGFLTFRFGEDGRLRAKRGADFNKDVETLIALIEKI